MKISLISFVLISLLFSCNQHTPQLIHLSGKTMGTTYNVKFLSTPQTKKEAVAKEIEVVLKKVNQQMSTYQKDSEISYFNHQVRLSWHKISPEFFTVTQYALELAKKTKGKFDPTIGPLVNLWGFGPDGKRKVPSKKQIEEAKIKVGFEKILLNKKENSLKKTIPGVYLDLSASAKGFGVDKVAEFLDRMAVKAYLVEIGGEVRTKGLKGEQSPWKVAIQSPHPDQPEKPFFKVLDLVDMALATSGDYRNFFKEGGKKYSHTIDFKTGKPIEHTLASVSVALKENCMKADSLATALMVMGPVEGYHFAEKEGIAAYFIFKLNGQSGDQFVTQSTSQFKKLFPENLQSIAK